MYKYKKWLHFCKRWPCRTYISTGRGFNSHPRQSFSLSVCGPFPLVGLTLTWFNMGRKLALHITLKYLSLLKYKCYTANVCKNVSLPSWLQRKPLSCKRCLKDYTIETMTYVDLKTIREAAAVLSTSQPTRIAFLPRIELNGCN